MNKKEFSEFHRLLAILIYEYSKTFYSSNLTDKSKSEIKKILKALELVQKVIIVGDDYE